MSRPDSRTQNEALVQALNLVPGLDASLGIAHARGRSESYLRLLQTFAETREADAETMRSHLAAEDYAELGVVAHNIKGVAGFLGAIQVEHIASEVSTAIRSGRDGAEIARLAAVLMETQSQLGLEILALLG